MRKVILYISMSIDGFIATKQDNLDWLSIAEKEGEDYGYTEVYEEADTYLVGRKTYDVILSLTGGTLPQTENMNCYVFTREDRPAEKNLNFYNDPVEQLIKELRSQKGKNIVCDGGGEMVRSLMEKDLIDEYIISVIPTILGDGKRLFLGGINQLNVKAMPSKYYDTGVVQLHYKRQTT